MELTLKQIKRDWFDKKIRINDILDCEDGCPYNKDVYCLKEHRIKDCGEICEQILVEKLIKAKVFKLE